MPPRIIGGTAGKTMQIRLVDGVDGDGAPVPTLSTDGWSLVGITREFQFEDSGVIMIHKAADGTAISVASADVYGFYGEHLAGEGPNDWGPLGSGSPGIARGALNEGQAIAQVGTRKVLLLESVGGLRAIERIAVATGLITSGGGDILVHIDLILTRKSK